MYGDEPTMTGECWTCLQSRTSTKYHASIYMLLDVAYTYMYSWFAKPDDTHVMSIWVNIAQDMGQAYTIQLRFLTLVSIRNLTKAVSNELKHILLFFNIPCISFSIFFNTNDQGLKYQYQYPHWYLTSMIWICIIKSRTSIWYASWCQNSKTAVKQCL